MEIGTNSIIIIGVMILAQVVMLASVLCGNHEGGGASDDLVDWCELGAADLPDMVSCSWSHPVESSVFMVGTGSELYRTTDSGLSVILRNSRFPCHPLNTPSQYASICV